MCSLLMIKLQQIGLAEGKSNGVKGEFSTSAPSRISANLMKCADLGGHFCPVCKYEQ